jgi:Zn-dependent protease with chaperone function
MAGGDTYGARSDVDSALALEPANPSAHGLSALLLARNADWAKAHAAASRAIELAPDFAVAHTLLANALLEEGDRAGSRAEAAKARALHFKNTEWLDAIDEANTRAGRLELLWKVPLFCAAGLLLGLFLIYLAGSALSRFQMASLSSVHSHMLRDEQTAGERLVLRLYRGVIWFGTLFFYVSVPAMVLLSLATGVGLVYAMFAYLSQIPIKIVAILLVAGIGGSWAIVRGLFLRAERDTDGTELTEAEEPRLFAALREVSEVAGSRMVDRVYLELGAMAAVREAGGTLRVLLGRGERVLHLGFWTLQGLTVSELKAILAHEYGHFSHGETRLTPIVGRIVRTLVGMLQRMAALGGSTMVNPVWWYLRLYFRVFLAATAGHSRRSELLADRAAALAYGGDAFARALSSVIEGSEVFDRQAGRIAGLLRQTGRPCSEIYRALEAAHALSPQKLRDQRLGPLLNRAASEFDSHPPPADRIERVRGVPGSRGEERTKAFSLLCDPAKTARMLAGIIAANVDAQLAEHGTMPPAARAMDADAQTLFAEGLALHDDAVRLQEQSDPTGDAMIAHAVERLQAALGEKDPLLVGALQTLARTQSRLGRRTDASATLQLALGILAEHPHAEEEESVRGLLKKISRAA